MTRKKLTAAKGFTISIVLCIIFTVLSSLILHDWGNISIEDVELTTSNGNRIVARVYVPDSATAENPAPAVIFNHGLTVNKESYSQYGLELARRGFVVVTPDMLNHGNSEITSTEVFFAPEAISQGYGTYACVEYLKGLDYVDQSQIGMAGHSAGGQATNTCVRLDDLEEEPAISAVYLVSSEPMYKDAEGNYANMYGARDFGVYYTIYDHVYFKGTDENGTPLMTQRWLETEEAKSLFSFGEDPSLFETDSVIPGHTYTAEIDGETYIRRVNSAREIHPKPQGGSNALAAICDFFQDVFTAPEYIVGQNQRFGILSIVNILGMMSVLAVCVFTLGMLTRIPFFKSLRVGDNAVLRPAPADKEGKIWFWCLTALNCVWAFVSISIIFRLGFGYCFGNHLAQQPSNIYAGWALLNGLFMLGTSFISYHAYAKKHGATMENWGLKMPWVDFFKSILLAILSCLAVFAITWCANHLFMTDWHYYFWGFKNVPLFNLDTFFAYLPMYLVFGLAVSIALNSAYHCKIANEKEWVNDLFFAAMNLIPALVISIIGWYMYEKTGMKPVVFGSNYTYTYTINAIPVFPIAVIVIRKLFKQCNNAYIPGIIAGILLCWLQVGCNFTMHTNLFYGPMVYILP